jgi:SAM-dependent methyltransferase
VTSLDVGPRLLDQVAAKCHSERVVGDVTRLPFADGSFDVVLATEVIEHTLDAGRAVSELVRVTAPGGLTVITTPNRLWLWAVRLATRLGLRPYEGVENWIRRGDLQRALESQPVEVLEFRGFNAVPFGGPAGRIAAIAERGGFGALAVNVVAVARSV